MIPWDLLNQNPYVGYAVAISALMLTGALGGALLDWVRRKLRGQ